MGRRMRAFDWAATRLGPPALWPQSLKTIVRVMLDSRFAMWMLWGEEQTFFCNDAYLPTVGIKRDWVLGARADKVWAEIWHDIGPRIDRVLNDGLATWDEGLQLFLERSGYPEETFHTFSYSPVYGDDDRISGMLCVVVEDTDRAIGERRLRVLTELAAPSTSHADSMESVGERLLRTLESSAADIPFAALYLTDATGDGARLAGRTASLPEACTPDSIRFDDATVAWPIAEVVRENHERRIARLDEFIGVVPSAWREPVQQAVLLPLAGSAQARPLGALILGVSPRRKFDDNYQGFFSLVSSQVSARLADAQAHIEERRRSQALAELDRAKNVFFSNVSHEFRTPLTLMLGPLEALIGHHALPADAVESLRVIQRNGLRLRKLVNSLLDFSRMEAGRIEASFQPTDLASLTRDIASVFRAAIEAAGLRFVVRCAALPEPVFVDREMWEKVVLNLLSNAFKFTFDGEIEVLLETSGDGVRLCVRDTGVGIPAEGLPHVFDRFHRIAGTRSRTLEGTGIGLALVKELARIHGGSVDVASEPGRGTCFAVTIPFGSDHLPSERVETAAGGARSTVDPSSFVDDALRGQHRAPASVALQPSLSANAPTKGAARILVVDDNADMRSYIERLLSPYWSVTTAGDGVQALAAMHSELPSLVITDVMMPNLDGYGLIQAIRGNPSTAALPVIVLSAQAGDEAQASGLDKGADDYLVKPFSTRELVARVQSQLMRAMARSVQEALDKRLADVFRHAPVGIALLRGPDHVFEFVNQEYLKLISGRDVLGQPVRSALAELEGQAIFELLDGVYASGEPHVGRAFPAMLLNTQTGMLEQHFFDFVYQPLRHEGGTADGIAVVAFQVTDLMLARRQAELANRAKDEFIAMLGHELRNPLAPIQTALALMRMQNVEVGLKERGIIERQVQHMVRLVDDLLDVARVTRGTIELKRSVVELASIVGNAIETASPLFEQRRQLLRLEVPSTGLSVSADPVRLSQVIANLLTNAAKFSEVGAEIRVEADRDQGFVTLRVRDHGLGMQPEELNNVFDLFVQGRQGLNRPQGGLGLGLAIARSLATLHGGSLFAESDGPGKGSVFHLRLPLATEASVGGTKLDTATAVDGSGLYALVVDDNEDAATTLAMLLSAWGYSVQVAHDGPSALRLLESRTFDIGVLDIGLPVMDGYELARLIRARTSAGKMRLIALTGYGQEADQQRSMEHGFDSHLVKPVEAGTLAMTLGKDVDS